MELQEKGEYKKWKVQREVVKEKWKDNKCLLTLDLKSSRSEVKRKHCAAKELWSSAVQKKKNLLTLKSS